jgi:hypothetical protein
VQLAVFAGVLNAYLLGVWRSVSRDALLEFAPFILAAGLATGLIVVRRRRKARVEAEGSQLPS